jgi:tetraacyldisaccharide 4'-kinase
MNSKVLLRPFSLLYSGITSVRNWLYSTGLFESFSPDVFTISVGNLTVGGTGKTPMVEHLIRALSGKFQVATLSRGYGRKTKGFVIADGGSSAGEVGDEPLQYYQKYSDRIEVVVCEKRVEGVLQIRKRFPTVSLVLLDDAFQHRPIAPHVNLLLNDFNRPFYKDYPFPEGFLRESRRGAVRADAVIVTKCPTTITDSEKQTITSEISHYTQVGTPVYFASTKYGRALSYVSNDVVESVEVVAVAGIAQPAPFFKYLRKTYAVQHELVFADHYNFTEDDLQSILKYAKSGTFVLSTEKDMVKLKPLTDRAGISGQFLYIPIEMDLGLDGARLSNLLEEKHDFWQNPVKKG